MSASILLRDVRHRMRVALAVAPHEAVRSYGRNPLVPPATLHSVGVGDFRKVEDDLFQLLLPLGRLQRDERVPDIGCGTGRVPRPLSDY